MVSFWSLVNDIIRKADILILVLDARMIKETRHEEIEKKIKFANKPLIYVISKCDLVEKNVIQKYQQRLKPAVFTSARKHYGTRILREKIFIQAKRAKINKREIKVGVLGYPNVGKSSLINAMKGSKSAPTSALSGYTRSIQNIRTGSRIIMIDTPGVLPEGEKDFMTQAIVGSLDYTKTQHPEEVIMELITKNKGMIEKHFNVERHEDPEETIEAIAIKNKILKKGGKPDTIRISRMILNKWQKGDIKK